MRLDLGVHNVIETLDATIKSGGHLLDNVLILDLTQTNSALAGFSSLFNGKYL